MKNKSCFGCSGFSERLWKGFFYSEDLPARDYLKFYSKNLNSLEVNSTFYRRPTNKTLEKWHQTTPEDFKFFIKIPKNVRSLRLRPLSGILRVFYSSQRRTSGR